ncbi:TPA: hypothetical protein P0E12_004960 [Vibrio harveyi]|nr:hypothetical protein [Vibrio harveyi]
MKQALPTVAKSPVRMNYYGVVPRAVSETPVRINELNLLPQTDISESMMFAVDFPAETFSVTWKDLKDFTLENVPNPSANTHAVNLQYLKNYKVTSGQLPYAKSDGSARGVLRVSLTGTTLNIYTKD